GLVFNKNTGDASASGKVEFQTPQASGSAVGIQYTAKTGTMNLLSAVVMTVNRPQPVHLNADHGVITKQPHEVVLTTVHMTREQQEAWSDLATFFLREDDTVDHIVAEGDVRSEIHGRASSNSETRERSDHAELFLTGSRNLLTTAVLTGNVQLDSLGGQPANANAGRATLHFAGSAAGQQLLETVHAEEGVHLTQKNNRSATLVAGATAASASPSSSAISSTPAKGNTQDVEMSAPVMDFIVKEGRLLERAETSGPPQIVITQSDANQKTVVTAAKFIAKFTDNNRLATLHGEPDAKIVSSLIPASKTEPSQAAPTQAGAAAQSDRVSTSRMLDVAFLPEGGVRSITQTGAFTYADGAEKAWSQRAEYTTADQLVSLTESPRVSDGGMTTTAHTIRIDRATGDAFAEGNVKSTYSDLQAQPNGAMLASSDPIHVTSHGMTANRSTAIAVYTGDARLWQDANVVQAPMLQFDREHRSLFAHGEDRDQTSAHENAIPTTLAQPVSTVLVQVDKTGKVTPVHITSARLHYADLERKVFLDGGVTAREEDATMTGEEMTVFLLPRSRSKTGITSNPARPGQVDRIVAEDKVVLTQPTRHATGDRLVYTSADDKYVLTGGPRSGPPSIFDAEQGKTTGDSLTFYRHDDRVLVDGRETSPAVTRTQVARYMHTLATDEI